MTGPPGSTRWRTSSGTTSPSIGPWPTPSRAAVKGRRVLEGVPGDRQLRLQRAGVLRPVPERVDLVTAVPERDEVLPGRPVRVRRHQRPAADRVVHRPDLLPVRAPRLHA